MELDDNFRKEWIDFMSTKVDGVYRVPLYIPDLLKNIQYMNKIPVKLNINVSVVEKYSRSVKVKFTLFGNDFEDIVYLPTSKSLQTIIEDTNKKISNKVNTWLKENDETFVINQYKNSNHIFFNSVERLLQEQKREKREQKLNRITNDGI